MFDRIDYYGLFGWNRVKPTDTEVILTASEIDAMIIQQETGRLAIALPKGDSILPQKVCGTLNLSVCYMISSSVCLWVFWCHILLLTISFWFIYWNNDFLLKMFEMSHMYLVPVLRFPVTYFCFCKLFLGRIACTQCVDAACLSVCALVTWVCCTEMAEWIDMLFRVGALTQWTVY